jgi:hypothetical protein
MAAADVLRTLVVAGVVSAGPTAPPSELVIDDIPGFELTSVPATDLDFTEFAAIEPDSVVHIEPDSEEAAGLVAAMQTWTDEDAGQTIVVEVVRAIDDDAAATFVDQVAANSIAVGLGAVDPPFGGAWSYSGALAEGWQHVLAWTQGPYAVLMTQTSATETDRAPIDGAAVQQVEAILAATGAEVSEDAAVDDEAPTPPTDAPAPDEDDGRFPVGSLMVVFLVAAVGVGVMLQQRRRVWGSR